MKFRYGYSVLYSHQQHRYKFSRGFTWTSWVEKRFTRACVHLPGACARARTKLFPNAVVAASHPGVKFTKKHSRLHMCAHGSLFSPYTRVPAVTMRASRVNQASSVHRGAQHSCRVAAVSVSIDFAWLAVPLCLSDLCFLLELCRQWAAARALVPFQFCQPAPARAVMQFEVESHHLMGSSLGAAIEKYNASHNTMHSRRAFRSNNAALLCLSSCDAASRALTQPCPAP